MIEDARRFGINISNSLPSLLADDFSYLDYAGITRKLSRLQKDAGLASVRALDANDHVIFEADPGSLALPAEHGNSIELRTPILDVNKNAIGYVEFSISLQRSFEFKRRVFWMVLFAALLSALIILVLILVAIARLLKPYHRVFENMELAAKGHIICMDDYLNASDERATLNKHFNQVLETLKSTQTELADASRRSALARLAAQVAHDIRSPLAALDSVMKDVTQLPEEKRIIVRSAVSRIRDIANNLIEKNREATASVQGSADAIAHSSADEPASKHLLSSLVDPLITEKRLQFRAKIGIEIECRLDVSSYGIFAQIQPTEFKRVLSNLLNNSVEALGEKGTVAVSLAAEEGNILLKVQDNGRGIPPKILAKLGQRGETHGKAGGSGLGLYHARTSVESWGGSLEIASEVGKGTTLIIKLPQAQPPDWFVSKLELEPGKAVVVLDDDTSIHQVWQGRFDSRKVKDHGIEVFHFSTPAELRNFVRENPAKAQNVLYLTDYELIGHKETGLGLVEELNLGDRSILITSRFEEKGILEHCLRLKVRMIPKGLAGFVPISISVSHERLETQHLRQSGLDAAPAGNALPKAVRDGGPSGFDAVLLDDDALVRMNWKGAARSKGLNLVAFKNPQEFLAAVDGFPKETAIYLDSKLGDGVKGEDIAKDLHAKGFTNLYLATGYDPESFPAVPWIKKVLSKSPPWQDAESPAAPGEHE